MEIYAELKGNFWRENNGIFPPPPLILQIDRGCFGGSFPSGLFSRDDSSSAPVLMDLLILSNSLHNDRPQTDVWRDAACRTTSRNAAQNSGQPANLLKVLKDTKKKQIISD